MRALLRRVIVTVSIFAVVAAALFLASSAPRPGRVAAETVVAPLSDEAYAALRDRLVARLEAADPREALTELRALVATSPATLRSCHALVHELGHAAYGKEGDFGAAISFRDDVCNSGYIHGVIEAYFSESSDVFEAMRAACRDYPPGGYLAWECFHGVGHGLMYYTASDLPKALEGCATYEDPFAASSCANGVFMDNFNTDRKLHPSRYLDAADPFYPCREQDTERKGACYLYAPTYYLSLHPDRYEDALAWCAGAEEPYVSVCAEGVGGQAMKEHMGEPKLVERACMSVGDGRARACIDGMAAMVAMHHGSLEPVGELCAKLKRANRPICESATLPLADLFEGR